MKRLNLKQKLDRIKFICDISQEIVKYSDFYNNEQKLFGIEHYKNMYGIANLTFLNKNSKGLSILEKELISSWNLHGGIDYDRFLSKLELSGFEFKVKKDPFYKLIIEKGEIENDDQYRYIIELIPFLLLGDDSEENNVIAELNNLLNKYPDSQGVQQNKSK